MGLGVVMAGQEVGWRVVEGGGGGWWRRMVEEGGEHGGGQRGRRAEGELGSGGGGGGVGSLAWVLSTCVETVSIPNVVKPECFYIAIVATSNYVILLPITGGH